MVGAEVAMRLDSTKAYLLPLIMGPAFDQADQPRSAYGQMRSLAVTFQTDPGAVRPLVPECYLIPDTATVTVAFGDHDRVDFMAGDGYRVAYVGVSARFEGEEAVDGLYILIMWENQTLPILLGRELIGIPKLGAEITAMRELEAGSLRASASVWGHKVMQLEVAGLSEQNLMVRRTAQKRVNAIPWLGYKHIPSLDGPPDASYPMVVWNEVRLNHLYLADHGRATFGNPAETDIGQLAGITTALSTLPLGEIVFASYAEGSAILRIDRSHRIQ
jgi:acetoacetate decarboxylase